MARGKDFMEQVKSVELMATKAKEKMNRKKVEGLLKVLEECKKHGGPFCPADVYKLDKLNEKEIQLEASYLKKNNCSPNTFQTKSK